MGEAVERCLGVFYADEDMVGPRDAKWLQILMNVLVGLFRWYGLADNVAKSRTMTCPTGALRLGIYAEDKDLKCTGVGDSYRLRIRQRVSCPECGVEVTAGPITGNHRRIHGTEPEIYWNRLLVSKTEHHLQVYDVRLLRTTKRCPSPLPGCPRSSHTWNGLHLHFSRIMIREEHPNPLPKCKR